MIIRRGTLQDGPAIADILNEIIAIGGTTAYETSLPVSHFDRLLDPANGRTFLHVAEHGSEVIGLQWLSPNDPPESHIGGIATFAKPGIAQRGIGTALFETTKEQARAQGYTEIAAVIRADNTGGVTYYEKMGFRDQSIEPGVPLRDGTPIDRVTKIYRL